MKSAAPNFTENNSLKEVYKGSLFKNLFSARKNLLTGYPGVKKGLAFPEANLNFGAASYTFKTTETADKVSAKAGGNEFQARYKKETSKWDISLKTKMGNHKMLCKYEERGAGAPTYVVGGTCNLKGLGTCDGKLNLLTGGVKKSWFLDLSKTVPGLKIGCDVKTNIFKMDLAQAKWNVGAAHGHKFGTTAFALNNGKLLTFNHCHTLNKTTSLAVEFVQALGNEKASSPFAFGFGTKLDDKHMLKVRVNNLGQLNGKLEKKFNDNVTIEMATCVDVHDPKTMMAGLPAFGFKIAAKC